MVEMIGLKRCIKETLLIIQQTVILRKLELLIIAGKVAVLFCFVDLVYQLIILELKKILISCKKIWC